MSDLQSLRLFVVTLTIAVSGLYGCNTDRSEAPGAPSSAASSQAKPKGAPPASASAPNATASSQPASAWFPYLPKEDPKQSRSVGDTSDGKLLGATELTPTAALGLLPVQRKRRLFYGTEPLVTMLHRAALDLHAATKTRLWVGNLSRQAGGDIRYSVSHNSGRDADIAFAYLDRSGAPVDPPNLIPIAGSGRAVGYPMTFDVKRTWLIVRSLLSHPDIDVQYLFISQPLREKLMTHARSLRESPQLLKRALTVLRQPYGSSPHNDHLHLRIYCSERDVLAGCRNTGIIHPWVRTHDAAKRAFVSKTAQLLNAEKWPIRRRAIERLALLEATSRADDVAERLDDPVERVRTAAAVALSTLADDAMIGRLAKRFEKENASGVRIALTQTLSDLGGKKAGRFFQTAVGHPRRPREATSPVVGPLPLAAIVSTVIRAVTTPEISVAERDERIVQLAAIEAAGRTERLEPLPQLIELLDDENADIRVAAAFALRRLTNLHYGIDWKAGSVLSMQRGRTRWRTAFERSKRASRNAWLVTGFKAAGYPVEAIDRGNVWHLARAVGGQDRLSYNAQRALMKLLKHEPKSLSWPKHDACAYWQRWMKRRRGRLKLPRPPKRSRCG